MPGGLDKNAECRKALRGVESVSVSSAVNSDGDLTVVRAVHESNQKCFVTTEYSALESGNSQDSQMLSKVM